MAYRLRFGGSPGHDLRNAAFSLARTVAGPWALGLLLVASLLLQATAVQTHVHFTAPTHTITPGERSARISIPATGQSPADCPLCQEAAMAGAYLLPPAIVVPPAPATLHWLAATALLPFGLRAPPRGWQSRAPPQ